MDDFDSSSSEGEEGGLTAVGQSELAVSLVSESSFDAREVAARAAAEDATREAASRQRAAERERKPALPLKKRTAQAKQALFDKNLALRGAQWRGESPWFDPAEVGRLMRDGLRVTLESGETVRVDAPVSHNLITSANLGLLDIKMLPIVEQVSNVEYDRKFASQYVTIRLKHPSITAHVFQTGTITTMGSRDEFSARMGVRMLARKLQRIHLNVLLSNFRVRSINLVAELGFSVAIARLARERELAGQNLSSELHNYVQYSTENPVVHAKIYHSGKITFGGESRDAVNAAFVYLYPICLRVRLHDSDEAQSDRAQLGSKRKASAIQPRAARKPVAALVDSDDDSDGALDEANFDSAWTIKEQ
jgi:TATA-box binding protein (TBP) (component of TFIID and TFIIIB)